MTLLVGVTTSGMWRESGYRTSELGRLYFLLSGLRPVIWTTTTSTPELLRDSSYAYLYASGGTPFAEVNLSSGAVTYLLSDALGSVRALVSSSGALLATTSYDAWGNPRTPGGLFLSTNFGFAGGYLGSQGLYYFIHRYYDPTTGQFISVDPAVNLTQAPYSYAGDNPVNFSDPTGLCVTTWFGCIGPGPANGVSGTLGALWNDTGGKAVSFVYTHRTGFEVGAGLALGVAAAATGVGAVVEGATLTGLLLGGGSVTLGLGASALDYGPCRYHGVKTACVGLALGAIGTFAGAISEVGAGLIFGGVITGDSLTASILGGLSAFGWSVGTAGTIVDGVIGFASGNTSRHAWPVCRPSVILGDS